MRNFQLGFRPVDLGLAKSNREADAGIQQNIVIGIIREGPAIRIEIELDMAEQALGETHLEKIRERRLDRQSQNLGIERDHLGRARKEDIFERGSLENPVV